MFSTWPNYDIHPPSHYLGTWDVSVYLLDMFDLKLPASKGCEFFYFIGATSFRLPCLTSPWESLRSKENNATEKASKQKKFLTGPFSEPKSKMTHSKPELLTDPWKSPSKKASFPNKHWKWGGTVNKKPYIKWSQYWSMERKTLHMLKFLKVKGTSFRLACPALGKPC